jgi:proline racemase
MKKVIFAVDTHTQGQSTRVLYGGLPPLQGKSLAEKKEYFARNLDHLRCAILFEPRGHSNMFSSVILEPFHSEAQIGVFFMDTGGYLNMCGHGLIGTVSAAVELGILPFSGKCTDVTVETPAGLVCCSVCVEGDKVTSVSFTNVPSFLFKQRIPLKLQEYNCRPFMEFSANSPVNSHGELTIAVDVAFGGSFFALISADSYGIHLNPQRASDIIGLGMVVKEAANKQIKVEHPELKQIHTIDLIMFSKKPEDRKKPYKNAVIFGNGQMDRSPCGTGTSAMMAVLYSKGLLKKGEPFWHESILGTRFCGEIVDFTRVGDYPAVVPRISSSSFICGFNQIVIDDMDPLAKGFLLK